MSVLREVTHIDNVRLGDDRASVVILDQTQLPNRTVYVTLRTAEEPRPMARAVVFRTGRACPERRGPLSILRDQNLI